MGDGQGALGLHEEALEIRQRIGDRVGLVESLNAMAIQRRRAGDLYQALDLHTRALALARELGLKRDTARSLGWIARIYGALEDYEPALDFFRQALEALPDSEKLERDELLRDLSGIHLRRGELDFAEELNERSIRLPMEIGGEKNAVDGFQHRATILGRRGRPEEGLVWVDRALTIGSEFDGARSVPSRRLARLRLLEQMQRWVEAVPEAAATASSTPRPPFPTRPERVCPASPTDSATPSGPPGNLADTGLSTAEARTRLKNDAAALRAAPIGVAMGQHATDVAREAAGIVLLDNEIAHISDAIRLGRRIFENLRKVLVYIVPIHVPIAGLALAPLVLGLPPLMLPMHVVLIEMVVDPICSIAFENEPTEPDLMQRGPRYPVEPWWALRSSCSAPGSASCCWPHASWAMPGRRHCTARTQRGPWRSLP